MKNLFRVETAGLTNPPFPKLTTGNSEAKGDRDATIQAATTPGKGPEYAATRQQR
jgi:hypothetical protein